MTGSQTEVVVAIVLVGVVSAVLVMVHAFEMKAATSSHVSALAVVAAGVLEYVEERNA